MKIRIFLWISCSCLLASQALAGGPTYSRFGIGSLLLFGGGRIDALGGSGIGLIGDRFINRLNPAGMARISLTRFSGGFEYSRVSSEDALGSSTYARGSFAGLAFAIPISTEHGIVWSMESSPYSLVNYSTQLNDNQQGITLTYRGSGGLSTLGTGLSWSVADQLSLGLKLNYLYGRTRQVARFDFSDLSFIDSEISKSRFHSGFLVSGGLIYEGLSDLLNAPSLKTFTIGAILSSPASVSMDDEDILTTTNSFDTTRTLSSSFNLPLAAGLGFSYIFSNRYMLAGDVSSQFWSSTNLAPVGTSEFRNSSRFSLGMEIMPERDIDNYFRRVAYRIGASYHSTYISVNGRPINEFYFTGGMGFPMGFDSRLNVGLHVGFRGTTSEGLQKDMMYRLTFSVSASEAWFLKIEED